jgi:hypothetical protein
VRSSLLHRLLYPLLVALFAVPLVNGQERFSKSEFGGEFEGFTKSSTEHEIVRLPQPLLVQKAEGKIVSEIRNQPLAQALFEVRGPGQSKRIYHTRTRENGDFALRGLKSGTYVFKATNDGFQSVVGSLVVCKGFKVHEPMRIVMRLGW